MRRMPTHDALDHRIVTEIQEEVTEKARGSLFSRVFLVKSDKVTITAWKLDLYRILHIFNVRSVAPAWSRLTLRFQTELAMDTNVVVSKICHDTVNTDADAMRPDTNPMRPDTNPMRPDTNPMRPDTNPMRPDTNPTKPDTNAVKTGSSAKRIDTAKTNTAALRTRRTTVRRQKLTDSKKRPVRVTRTLFIAEPTLTPS